VAELIANLGGAFSTRTELNLTPLLNESLDVLMKEERFTDAERVDLCVIRHAWGNWLAFAAQNPAHSLWPYNFHRRSGGPIEHSFDVPKDLIEALMLGEGACPWCGKDASKPKRFVPRGFRWHRQCMALAYARDAINLGCPEQRQWGASIFAEADQ
jgi:hypothetical protein